MSDKSVRCYLVKDKSFLSKIPVILREKGYKTKNSSNEDSIFEIDTNFEYESDYNKLKQQQYCFKEEERMNKVYLCNNPSNDLYHYIVDNWKMKHYPYIKNSLVHSGHYIAKYFRKYLIPSDKVNQKLNHFFGKGNVLNVYPQSAESNCGPEGQLKYERKVWEFLDEENNSLNREVCYEVENITIDVKVSLLRTIKPTFFDNEILNKNESFHVFIPNIEKDKMNGLINEIILFIDDL